MGYRPKTKLYKHQKKEILEHGRSAGRAYGWQMRTGKSKEAVDNAGALFTAGQITGVLIFAPNGVHEDWILKQFPDHCGVPYEGMIFRSKDVRGSNKEYKKKYLEAVQSITTPDMGRMKVLSVNSETVWRPEAKKLITRFLKMHPQFFFVVDECHQYGKAGSKRTTVARAVGKHAKYVRILSGTITGNSPLRVFSQYEIVKEGALGFTRFSDFENEYAIITQMRTAAGRTFPQIVGYKNLEDLQRRMAPYTSVVLRKDCDDMPNLVPVPRYFEMAPKQLALYEQLRKKSWIEIEETGERIAYDGGVKANKLQQIINGFWYGPGGEVHEVFADDEDNPKIALLRNEIENVCVESREKMIVWCPFDEDVDRVMKLFARMKIEAAQYDGRVKGEQRRKNEVWFRDTKEPAGLVAKASAGGAGKDFSSETCKTVLWFSPTRNLIDWEQASERATKIGAHDIAVVSLLANKTLDPKIVLDLEARINVADVLARGGLAKYISEAAA